MEPFRPPPLHSAETAPCFLALIEIERFEPLKRTIGHAAARHVLDDLAQAVEYNLPGLRAIRADRASIEVLFNAAGQEDAAAVLRRLAVALAGRQEVDGYRFDRAPTIGFAALPERGGTDEALVAAERALDQARRAASRVAAADAGGAETLDRLTLLCALQEAMREDALALDYQPKVAARTGQVEAVEALLRWRSPTLGPIAPDRFVPLAEETGDIGALTEWVLGRALRDRARLAAGGPAPRIDINLSGASLEDERFVGGLIERAAGAGTGAIGFEITETSMIADPARALANLRRCAGAGIPLAIDDYGAGFSSLAYLRQLPVDELKIDRSFIQRLASHPRDPLLVRSTIDLAHALEMRVTAEGVESAHVLALLQVMGCDLLQGFHLAVPMPPDTLAAYLAGDAALAALRRPPARLGAAVPRAGRESMAPR